MNSSQISANQPRDDVSGRFVDAQQSAPDISDLTPDEPEFVYIPVYRFPADVMGAVEQRIAKANARLLRAGISEQFTYTSEPFIERRNGQAFDYVKVTLNRPSIAHEGWTFTGAHDFTPGGGILHLSTTADAAEVIDNHCDHCGSKRARNRVYTVIHPEKGTLQIGASCLGAFLGMKPVGLWALEDSLDLDTIERESSGGQSSAVYPSEDLLVVALAATDDGAEYVSAGRATFDNPPTSAVVRGKWTSLLADGDTKKRRVLARRIIRWAKKLDEEPGSYLGNLHEIFSGRKEDSYVRNKHLGYAVSAVSAYHREQEEVVVKAAVAAAPVIKPEFLGEPKTKLENLTATVQRRFFQEDSVYGQNRDRTLLVLLTDTGHCVTWWASGYRDEQVGDRVAITRATVKENTVYEGVYQTVVTRAKMGPVG
jgi:hypothetical protein